MRAKIHYIHFRLNIFYSFFNQSEESKDLTAKFAKFKKKSPTAVKQLEILYLANLTGF
jgi:hypothetical protein